MTELSSRGAWLKTTRSFSDGTLLRLRCTLPDGTLLDLRAEVMWSSNGGMALEWLDDEAERIAAAIEALPPTEAAPARFSFADGPHPS